VRGVRVLARVKVMLTREKDKVKSEVLKSQELSRQRTALLDCIAACSCRMRSKLALASAVGRCATQLHTVVVDCQAAKTSRCHSQPQCCTHEMLHVCLCGVPRNAKHT
jgi:hypothetical protein